MRGEKPMDQTQTELVRATFARIAPIADQAGAMLYENMVAIDPDLRRLRHRRSSWPSSRTLEPISAGWTRKKRRSAPLRRGNVGAQ
jgi:hypothetical protein